MSTKHLTPIDMNKLEILNLRVQQLAAAPGSPVEGLIYYDTVLHGFYVYNGTTWVGIVVPLTEEQVEDYVAAMVASPSGEITFAYTDNGASAGTLAATLVAASIANSKLANMANATVKGRNTAGTGAPEDVTMSQLKTLLALAESDVTGLVSDLALKAPLASPTFTGTVTVPTPSGGTDAANKAYVDAAAAGIDWKASVRAATTANGTLATAFANGQAIDGVTLATGNRILLKNQTTGADNGIYVVQASGAPVRATDADAAAEVTGGMAVFVEEGTTNADSGWLLTNDGAVTIGSTALTFIQFTSLGQITAGNGLTKTGSTIDVQVDGSSIEINADTLRVKAGGVTDAMLASTFAKKYTALIGDGSTTAIAVTHGLGTQYCTAQVFDASTGALVLCDVTITSSTVITFTFAVAPTSNQYRVVIVG